MSSAKQEQQQSKVPSKFEKYSKIGDPEGIVYIVRCLMNGTISTQSLKTLAQSEIGKKAIEVELSLLLLSSMNLLSLNDDTIEYSERLSSYYDEDEEHFCDWFVDEFIEYVMANEIIDIETISYEIGSDAYLMSPSSIKRKYAGFRNMLVDFGVIALRSDARYTILQKLDKYIARPEVRRKITEKQLFAQQQKKKELGNKGEEWVLSYEKRRITNPDLQRRIKRISLIDVGAGFDIVSYNNNDSTEFDRFIEVKTYKGNEHFHWSHNEIEKASLMGEQYYIYLVDADCIEYEDYEPQIIQDPIKRVGESEGWAKRPDSYLVERVVEAKDGHILPLFTNVDDSMPVPKPMSYQPYSPTIEITTPEIKIAAKTIRHIADNDEYMVANAVDVRTLSEESRNEILKKSLEALFRISNFKGQKLFIRTEQWIGVYRDCIELGFSIENDYRGFVDQVRRLDIADIPYSCTVEVLEMYDVGIFQKPQEEWTFELYETLNKGRYEKTFRDLHSVAQRFYKILGENIPQKRVVSINADNNGHKGKTKEKFSFVIISTLTNTIISKIFSYLEGKSPSQAKYVMKPIRAAQDAGVIRRITFEEMQLAFPDYCPNSKASVSKYTKEDDTPYSDEAFKAMVKDFKSLLNGQTNNENNDGK